jgi:hypothetical protein
MVYSRQGETSHKIEKVLWVTSKFTPEKMDNLNTITIIWGIPQIVVVTLIN